MKIMIKGLKERLKNKKEIQIKGTKEATEVTDHLENIMNKID